MQKAGFLTLGFRSVTFNTVYLAIATLPLLSCLFLAKALKVKSCFGREVSASPGLDELNFSASPRLLCSGKDRKRNDAIQHAQFLYSHFVFNSYAKQKGFTKTGGRGGEIVKHMATFTQTIRRVGASSLTFFAIPLHCWDPMNETCAVIIAITVYALGRWGFGRWRSNNKVLDCILVLSQCKTQLCYLAFHS